MAEKPSVARAIAAALAPGPPVQRQGGGRGAGRGDKWKPPVLVFEANVGRLGACEHVVTSVAGHLMNMEFEDPYRCGVHAARTVPHVCTRVCRVLAVGEHVGALYG